MLECSKSKTYIVPALQQGSLDLRKNWNLDSTRFGFE